MTNPHDNTSHNSEQVDISKSVLSVRDFPSPWGDSLTGPQGTSAGASNGGDPASCYIYTKLASRPEKDGEKRAARKAAQAYRFALQSAARDLLPDHRVAWCLRRLVPEKDTVDVVYRESEQRAHYRNLMTCAAVWECPVCAARITERRREELNALLQQADGLTFGMLTFTTSHRSTESLQTVLDRLLDAYRRFTSGRWYQAFKNEFRLLGTLKALDITHTANGWHPHLHVLVVSDSLFTPVVGLKLEAMAARRWHDLIDEFGGYASIEHGVHFQVGNKYLPQYVAKLTGERMELGYSARRWGLADEITKVTVKRGRRDDSRSMNGLLEDYIEGDEIAGDLWVEGVAALSGRLLLSASRGFWELLGRDASTVPSDEELVEESVEAADEVLASLTVADWRIICRLEMRGPLLAVASDGDAGALWAFLHSLGVGTPASDEKTASGPLAASGSWLRVNLDDCSVQTVVRPSGDAPIWTGKHWEW